MKYCASTALLLFVFLVGCASQPASVAPRVDAEGYVTLRDDPAVRFATSGWNHSDTSDPFILTPNYLTNALVGVTRFESGEMITQNGPRVPATLNAQSIRGLLDQLVGDEENFSSRSATVHGREVVIADYPNEQRSRREYAFEFEGNLIRLIIVAQHGDYFEAATAVAENIVGTISRP
ncbi:hypothetical protein [Marinimicrobium sp. ABcell2]|uniref:hypothetical protein n=1 Tax=Marinimicrobium sp. ABcell2 TaxID=3069751 RepID=UPI0027B07F96|nr:hypothetical protein [Marinimicrobium sp. ABcell2]MDQ2076774.1 hypothetical protein [Marinimicrobium sp. ABcell2]